jgi:hypothetical protein
MKLSYIHRVCIGKNFQSRAQVSSAGTGFLCHPQARGSVNSRSSFRAWMMYNNAVLQAPTAPTMDRSIPTSLLYPMCEPSKKPDFPLPRSIYQSCIQHRRLFVKLSTHSSRGGAPSAPGSRSDTLGRARSGLFLLLCAACARTLWPTGLFRR